MSDINLTDKHFAFLHKVGDKMKVPPQKSPFRAVMYDLLEWELLDLVAANLYITDAGLEALRRQ